MRPCTLADLRAREYHYWALGHIHSRETLCRDDPWVVFPGNLQGRHARETGPKGCMLVTVDDRHEVVAAEPRWLDVVRWETCPLDAGGARDGDEVVARFHDRLLQVLPSCDDRLLALRVEVRGDTPGPRGAGLARDALDQPVPPGRARRRRLPRLDREGPVPDVAARSQLEDLLSNAPLAELATFLDELRGDDAQLSALGSRALDDLTRKLPSDLADSLDTPQKLRALLDQVGPLLFERLQRL